MKALQIGIVGARGYVGSELARLVLSHPHFELAMVCSRSQVGESLASCHPGLDGLTQLTLSAWDPESLAKLDVVFLATPHGTSQDLAKTLESCQTPMIVDMAADHRHAEGWVYGQPEWNQQALHGATRIAVPGCFATAISLALAPLAQAQLLTTSVQVVALTGSTGSGVEARPTTHHPSRFANIRAYKVLSHQHVPEVQAFLGSLGSSPAIDFVPQSAPLDRGIFATCFAQVSPGLDARALYADAYGATPLVRLREHTPELRFVRGTAFCDLAVHQTGNTVVALSAIDNLGRGAAAQGIQALNCALGLAPETGLMTPSLTP